MYSKFQWESGMIKQTVSCLQEANGYLAHQI